MIQVTSPLTPLHPVERGIVGFIPTMGALHEGHLSLIRAARKECDQVIVSILVNPFQFAAHEDFNAYPRTLEKDLALCEAADVDVVFCPDPLEIYPENFQTRVIAGDLKKKYCGVTRPIFFDGVLTVVAILFNLIRPQKAYFGEKDYQQLFLVKQMVKDLRMPIEIVGMPIIREVSGLALSSRNVYLTDTQKQEATGLFQAILAVQEAYRCGERDTTKLLQIAREKITLEIDYVSLVSTQTLQELTGQVTEPARLLMAAYIGQEPRVRLIDNGQV